MFYYAIHENVTAAFFRDVNRYIPRPVFSGVRRGARRERPRAAVLRRLGAPNARLDWPALLAGKNFLGKGKPGARAMQQVLVLFGALLVLMLVITTLGGSVVSRENFYQEVMGTAGGPGVDDASAAAPRAGAQGAGAAPLPWTRGAREPGALMGGPYPAADDTNEPWKAPTAPWPAPPAVEPFTGGEFAVSHF